MSLPTILLPVDGSEHSTRATSYAIKMTHLMDARLLLLYCHRPFPVKLGDPYFQKAIDAIMAQSDTLLAPFRSVLSKKGISFEELIMEGPAGKKICDIAQVEGCEMIIMGSRGRSDLKGLLLGSVAHRVLQQAPCPVLIVR